jgi:hypothetical protein
MSEEQTRKYDRKLDELRAQYEKLLKNVRQEERVGYQAELQKIVSENQKLK